MQYKATSGPMEAFFYSQTRAEAWAQERAEDTGEFTSVESGEWVVEQGETIWRPDPSFEPRWFLGRELKRA